MRISLASRLKLIINISFIKKVGGIFPPQYKEYFQLGDELLGNWEITDETCNFASATRGLKHDNR